MDTNCIHIIYQDDDLIAIDKAAGWLVHPSDVPQEDHVVAMKLVRDALQQQVEVVHRLDRPTSGILLFALNKESSRRLKQDFEHRLVLKDYWALVDGEPPADEWLCQEALRKTPEDKAKEAETAFRVLERRGDGLALVEARPHTGRYHQIRRHLQSVGCPIVGDYRYHQIERCDALGQTLGTGAQMLLKAMRLRFKHPRDGRLMDLKAPEETTWM